MAIGGIKSFSGPERYRDIEAQGPLWDCLRLTEFGPSFKFFSNLNQNMTWLKSKEINNPSVHGIAPCSFFGWQVVLKS